MSYQPVWRDGREVSSGTRESASRYEAIRRDLTGRAEAGALVLDFGALAGYFSVRLAEDFGAHVVAVDKSPHLPAEMISTPSGGRVIPVRKRATLDDLGDRGYDVVLLLSVLHHLTWWPEMLAWVRTHAKVAYVEIPDEREHLPNAVAHRDTAAMDDAIREAGGTVIAWTPGHDPAYSRPLYVIGRL